MTNQLVSITVVSYNSGSTILETLESIKNQSYARLELIISDDCSTDNTVSLCEEWLSKNKSRFERVVLLTTPRNTGVCENSNRCKRAAQGLWIKGIAGDDILMPDCITDFMDFANNHPEASFITSLMSVYNETFEKENCIVEKKGPTKIEVFNQPISVQLKQMAYDSYIQAPSVFIKKEVFDAVGGYSGKYPFEDWPFYMDVLEKGVKLFFMEKVTVGYRVHQSISNASGKLFNYRFNSRTHAFLKERCFKYYSKRKVLATKGCWAVEKAMFKLKMDKNNSFNKFIYESALWLLARIGGK